MPTNLSRLKHAYQAWNDTKGGSIAKWGELMADKIAFSSVAARPSLEFAGDRSTRNEVMGYLAGALEQWQMVHFTPQTFVEQDGRISMFGNCAYRNRTTGKVAEFRIAHLWEFEGGKIVRLAEIFDTGHAAIAATPD